MSHSSKFHRLGLCVAATALWASGQAPAVAALGSYCTDGSFSQAVYAQARSYGVCGQIQGGGSSTFSAYVPATFTVTGAPLQSGTLPVGVSGFVTGTGLIGSTSASGYFGDAHVYASAQDTNPRTSINYSSLYTQGNVSFIDGFTVGSSNVEATVTVAVDGSITVGSSGDLYFSLYDVTPYQSGALVSGADLEPITVNGMNLGYRSYDFVFQAGHSYAYQFDLVASASASVDFLGYYPEAIADLSNTGTLNFDVVTPGASLSFLSGHDYSSDAVVTDPSGPPTPVGTNPAAVPEPAIVSLFFGGLAGLAFVGRRRSSRTAEPAPHGRAIA